MDIAETFARFAHEQHDAYDPERKTRFDGFGHPIDTPTVEGFDQWGPNPFLIQRQARVREQRRQDAEHAHTIELARQAGGDARRRANRLIAMRNPFK